MKTIKALPLILIILLYGCTGAPKYIELTYHPQENINRIDVAGNIEVKVKVNDLRTEVSKLQTSDRVSKHTDFMDQIIELTAYAIETELINRGFKLGDRVLIEVDLLTAFSTFYYGELTLHVDVKKSNGFLVYSNLIRGKGKNVNDFPLPYLEDIFIAFDAALKEGISKLVNDPEFIKALIKANMD